MSIGLDTNETILSPSTKPEENLDSKKDSVKTSNTCKPGHSSSTRSGSSTSSGSSSSSGSSTSSNASSGDSSSGSSCCSSQVDDSDADPTYEINEDNESEEPNSVTELDIKNRKSRKRKRNPDGWKRNISKQLRNSGKEYRSLKTGKLVPPKKILPPCKATCKLKCTTKFSEEDRQQYFKDFWELGSLERQRHFILDHMQNIQPKYRHVVIDRKKERSLNKAYYFTKLYQRKQVCFLYFRNTLGISERFVRTVKTKEKDGWLDVDLRGKNKHSVVPEEIKSGMRNHLSSIPAVDSHYTRANTQRKYIEGGKTVTDLYNDYVNLCKVKNEGHGSLSLYRHLFNYEYNMSFHIPKKDQCLKCTTYKNSNPDEQRELELDHQIHIEEKELSRAEKNDDKTKRSELFQVACFDLQAALPVPRGDVSSFYYKSRLNCYNFTVCELQQKELGPVESFFWHEGEGKRGASEIGTCLLKFLKKKADVANSDNLNIVLYSDNCGGQGKNKFIITAFMYAIAHYKINSITHKFFVVGHGQNEGDASHSVIEKAIKKALKNGPIYIPAHYAAIISCAKKKGNKFRVHELAHDDFYDLKDLTEKVTNSPFNENFRGAKFNFNDIRIVKVERAHLDRFFYKMSYKEPEFQAVVIRDTKTRQRKKLNKLEEYNLVPAYSGPLPISKRKFSDLQSLLQNKSIPAAHKLFYTSLHNEEDEHGD